jgi:hypothetical protein
MPFISTDQRRCAGTDVSFPMASPKLYFLTSLEDLTVENVERWLKQRSDSPSMIAKAYQKHWNPRDNLDMSSLNYATYLLISLIQWRRSKSNIHRFCRQIALT